MFDPLAALTSPPHVAVIDGEIVLTGDRVSVSYTPEAARALIASLNLVLDGLDAAA